MPEWGTTDTPERTRNGRLIVLGPIALYALVGTLSRLFGRRKGHASGVDRAVREVRGEMGRGDEVGLPQPTPEEISKRREERRRREVEEARR